MLPAPELVKNYLSIAVLLFAFGAAGLLARRNLIVMFLCAELMLQGVALSLVAFSVAWGTWHGQVLGVFVIAIAAAEAGIALALVLLLYRRRRSLDSLWWQQLREPGAQALAPPEEEEELEELRVERPWLRLPPAGLQPPRPREPIDAG
jgi:NADH-quinone oxidoreductase subunit K